MRNECFGLFFFTSVSPPILFSDRRVLYLRSFQSLGGLLVKCVSKTSKMSMLGLKIKVLISCECLASCYWQVAILSDDYVIDHHLIIMLFW
jgi:hypothetical protein